MQIIQMPPSEKQPEMLNFSSQESVGSFTYLSRNRKAARPETYPKVSQSKLASSQTYHDDFSLSFLESAIGADFQLLSAETTRATKEQSKKNLKSLEDLVAQNGHPQVIDLDSTSSKSNNEDSGSEIIKRPKSSSQKKRKKPKHREDDEEAFTFIEEKKNDFFEPINFEEKRRFLDIDREAHCEAEDSGLSANERSPPPFEATIPSTYDDERESQNEVVSSKLGTQITEGAFTNEPEVFQHHTSQHEEDKAKVNESKYSKEETFKENDATQRAHLPQLTSSNSILTLSVHPKDISQISTPSQNFIDANEDTALMPGNGSIIPITRKLKVSKLVLAKYLVMSSAIIETGEDLSCETEEEVLANSTTVDSLVQDCSHTQSTPPTSKDVTNITNYENEEDSIMLLDHNKNEYIEIGDYKKLFDYHEELSSVSARKKDKLGEQKTAIKKTTLIKTITKLQDTILSQNPSSKDRAAIIDIDSVTASNKVDNRGLVSSPGAAELPESSNASNTPELSQSPPTKKRKKNKSLAELCAKSAPSSVRYRVGLSKRHSIEHLHSYLPKK